MPQANPGDSTPHQARADAAIIGKTDPADFLRVFGEKLIKLAAIRDALGAFGSAAIPVWAEFDKLQAHVLNAIECWPATDIDGLKVKARAVKYLHDPGQIDLGANTTDARLAVQIIRGLAS